MRLGKILEAVPYPFLILQSKQDQLTLYSFFEEESKTFSSEISVKLFDSGAHVSSYLVSENKQVYEDKIKNFLAENSL
jgi:predicted alpha/beta-fold hydrolase